MLKGLAENLGLKLFSLLVALLLFLFVGFDRGTAVDVRFPLEVRTPHDLLVVSELPHDIAVTLKGPWATFRSYKRLQPVVLDLKDAEPGKIRRSLEASDIPTPTGMRVVAIRPATIDAVLDSRIEKAVMVEVFIEGHPAFGYELAEITTEPKRVRVVGPAEAVGTMNLVLTRPVSVADRDSGVSVTVALKPPTPPVRLGEDEPHRVKVFVDIREEILQQTFVVPVVAEKALRGTRLSKETVRISLKGPRSAIASLKDGDLRAVVDASPREDGGRTFEAVAELMPQLPERIQQMGQSPKVEVTLPLRRR